MREDVQEFIDHHGVKGMRWGVRTKSGGRTSSDFKKSTPLRNRNPSELTNRQLKTVNERVQLETNYRKLHPSTIEKGRQNATIILATLGFGVAGYNMVKSPAGQAAIKAGKSFLEKIKK